MKRATIEKEVEEPKDSRSSSTEKNKKVKRKKTEGNSRRNQQKQKTDQQYLGRQIQNEITWNAIKQKDYYKWKYEDDETKKIAETHRKNENSTGNQGDKRIVIEKQT